MSAWIESASENFVARHEERDQRDVGGVLDLLEDMRERLGPVFGALPDEVTVVLHPSVAQLDLAQPFLPVVRRLTTPAARRYVAGWAGRGALHTLAPRQLAERAANVEGSREVLALTPAALYVQLVVAENNRALPPPWTAALDAARPRVGVAHRRRRPVVLRPDRARPAGDRPAPARGRPSRLPARPARRRAARRHAHRPRRARAGRRGGGRARRRRGPAVGSREALLAAFNGRAMVHTEGTWRAHLSRMAGR